MKCHLWLRFIADGHLFIEIAPSRQAFVENSEDLPSRSSERINFGMIPPAFVLRTSAFVHFGATSRRGSLRSSLRSERR
jgi:hypothetical protein